MNLTDVEFDALMTLYRECVSLAQSDNAEVRALAAHVVDVLDDTIEAHSHY